MDSHDFVSSDFQEIIRNLIAYFILRQQLVVLAVLDLWSHTLHSTDDYQNISVKPYQEKLREKFEATRADKGKSVQIGVWKHDWEYFTHGIGCRLIHKETKERLEWDAPDAKAFNPYWFMNHLEWRLPNESTDPYIERCIAWLDSQEIKNKQQAVFAALSRLSEREIIYPVQGNWKFSADSSPAKALLPDEVVSAMRNLMAIYRQHVYLAIEAMTQLRPDVVAETLETEWLNPTEKDEIYKLLSQQNAIKSDKSKAVEQVKSWKGEWDGEIRYKTIQLNHKRSGEIIRWAIASPRYINSQFYTWANWFCVTEVNNPDAIICVSWIENNLPESHQLSSDFYNVSAFYLMIRDLLNRHLITGILHPIAQTVYRFD